MVTRALADLNRNRTPQDIHGSTQDLPHPLPGRAAARRRPHSRPAAPAARSGRARLQEHQPGRQQGRAGRRARHRRERERAGRDPEEAGHHRQRGADRGQRMGRPPGGHGQRGNGQHLRGAQPLPAGRIPAAVRPARRLQQHRRQRQHRHHLQRAEEARRPPRRAGRRLPAGRHQAGGGRLLHLRPADHAGADRGRRRGDVHARPRAGLLRADRRRTSRSRPTPRNSRST